MNDPIAVRVRRNGRQTELRVPGDKLQELMNWANDHFGNPRMIGGPRLEPAKPKKRRA